MQNKLIDLNNHLFASLERLNEEDLKPDRLDFEVSRSKAVTHVAKHIIDDASLMLDAQKHFDELGTKQSDIPSILQISDGKKK